MVGKGGEKGGGSSMFSVFSKVEGATPEGGSGEEGEEGNRDVAFSLGEWGGCTGRLPVLPGERRGL